MRSATGHPQDEPTLERLARTAIGEGEEAQALPFLSRATERVASARLWQWRALLERALDEHAAALASFTVAVERAPEDGRIAHGLARTLLEAGLPAEAAYERALQLEPGNGEIILGLAAARLAAGNGANAEAELTAILERAPHWYAGHLQLAQLRAMLGNAAMATVTVEAALLRNPADIGLWQTLFDILTKRESYGELDDAIARATSHIDERERVAYQAVAAAELGRAAEAERLFSAAEDAGSPLPVWRLRHLLRSERLAECLVLIDRELTGPKAADIWPYAALAWRAADDPRYNWLCGSEGFVSVGNMSEDLPELGDLAQQLRSLHNVKGHFLDQSVRGGTQTDGALFSRLEPAIRQTREAVIRAIDRYVAQLPPPSAGHPLLAQRRDRRRRFAGSWSVRLRDAGFHAQHVHPQGWISSALYVSLPERTPNDPAEAGWLTLGGSPAGLGLGLAPLHRIKPRPGQLVLFPSWMWHGTEPFLSGERLTIAFDVARPI